MHLFFVCDARRENTARGYQLLQAITERPERPERLRVDAVDLLSSCQMSHLVLIDDADETDYR